ncbi:CPBP family intramembrane glutamic endopeptidase [Bacillus massilinigeriensis]|uniref:CPBP family intramembrane glutamic endopeptidase n=1 Tax=Bacillus massilionigeriensis TaxID=1805475 RepID=UPI00096ADB81|nr:CPBP family intramembrane glutamic endopeptidase [Bacillus massilionigeriensis]
MKKNYIRSLAIILINSLTIILLMIFLGRKMESATLMEWGILASLGAILQTVSILLFYKFVDKKPLDTLDLKMNKRDLLFSVFSITLTICLFFIYLVAASKLDHFSIEWKTEHFSRISFYLMLLVVGFGWFNAAFTEELLYRWYLVSNLKHLSTMKLYLATGLFFMLSHLFKGDFNPFYLLFLLVTSCSLLYVYLRTGGKLLPVTFAHMIQNLTINHLVGSSDLAILHFETEPSQVHLLALTILYNLLIITLATVMYRKSEGMQQNTNIHVHGNSKIII